MPYPLQEATWAVWTVHLNGGGHARDKVKGEQASEVILPGQGTGQR